MSWDTVLDDGDYNLQIAMDSNQEEQIRVSLYLYYSISYGLKGLYLRV